MERLRWNAVDLHQQRKGWERANRERGRGKRRFPAQAGPGAGDFPLPGDLFPGERFAHAEIGRLPGGEGEGTAQAKRLIGDRSFAVPARLRFPRQQAERIDPHVPPAGNGPVRFKRHREPQHRIRTPRRGDPFDAAGERKRHGPLDAIRRSGDADGNVSGPGKRNRNTEGLPWDRGEGKPAKGRLPFDNPGLGAVQAVGLQRPSPQFRVRPDESKDSAAEGELHLPLRLGGAGKSRVPEDKTCRPFRIVPRTVGGDGELRLPLPDDAPHVRNPGSAGGDPPRDIQFPRRLRGRDPLPRVQRAGETKRGGVPRRLELPDAQDTFLEEKIRLDRRERPDPARVPGQRHVTLRPFEGGGDMRPGKALLANPEFADDGLEPAERARESKEDRSVHEKNLGKGGTRAFLPRRYPPIVESAVSFARFQAKIPDTDPGDGKIPGEKTQRREGDVDRTGASER